jgi:prepilin-type N-terminal cleavage/methylation domain-containing protein
MMFHRFGLLHKNQKGFTLVELLVAILITAIIVASVTMAIFQVFTGNARTSNHMTAVRQVQEAGYWVSHDTQMSNNVTTSGATGFPLILKWRDSDNLTLTHSCNYTLVSNVLWRNLDGQNSTVARYINDSGSPPQTSCDFTDGKLIFTVTATVGSPSQQRSETRVYEIVPRPGS